jgi:hypothetical protein
MGLTTGQAYGRFSLPNVDADEMNFSTLLANGANQCVHALTVADQFFGTGSIGPQAYWSVAQGRDAGRRAQTRNAGEARK